MCFEGTRVYITGATGFIGGVIARRFIEEGATLTALVRPGTAAGDLERAGAHIVRGNVTEPATLDLSGQHVVVHAAAWVGFGIPPAKLDLFRRTNVGGTENVLHAAENAGVRRFIHVSSIAALGATEKLLATEETPRASFFKSEYERTKTMAHEAVMSSKLVTVLPMPGLVLGRNGPFDPLLIRLARGRVPALPADDAVKGWVHVEDVADAVLTCAQKGQGPYLLVDENVRATELIVAGLEEAGLPIPRRRVRARTLVAGAVALERAYHLFGKTPPVSEELVRSLTIPMSYDSTRARKELGWRPSLVTRFAHDLSYYAGRP